MTSQNRPGSRSTEPIDRTEKKTLLVRIGIAGVLIVALIGALALFEQQQNKPEPAAPQSVTSPGPPQSLPAPGSQNQASGAIAPPPAEPPAKAEPPAEPERSGPPRIAEPAAPDRLAGGKPAIEKAPPPEDTHPRLVIGKGGETPAAARASPAAPAARGKAAILESQPTTRRTAGGSFLVQVGVFYSLDNAEELRRKLADAGIPAQIEARVQVGPFATRAEAAAAQKKLKSLGMDPGMLLPARR